MVDRVPRLRGELDVLALSKIRVSGASKLFLPEITCTLFASRAWRRSMMKSPPGWPRPIESANSDISCHRM
jgi:hypothetical protein